jgi:hypothetical protein
MKHSQKFEEQYHKIFQKNPLAANLYLLLCKMADSKGRVKTTEKELMDLMTARFNRPDEYAFGGELKK